MKKSTFIGNFVAWVAVAAVCIAFLAWYHSTDAGEVASVIEASAPARLGVVLASPVLLYAMGAVLGLLLVWFKKIELGRGFKRAWRIVGILALALFALAGVPVLAGDAAGIGMGPAMVIVVVSRMAPILVMMLGFVYALGCAGVDKSRRSRLEKYLPDDHFE